MKKILYITTVIILAITNAKAQQGFGTNTPAPSSVVDITAANKGVLLPRVALTGITDVTTIPSAANALTVFNTATTALGTANDVTPGYYYWDSPGVQWVRLLTGADAITSWGLKGNADPDPSANSFVGTTDEQDLVLKTAATERLRITSAGNIDIPTSTATTGIITKGGVPFIHNILENSVGVGLNALNINTTGDYNTALGVSALQSNTTGSNNVAIGEKSLSANLSGSGNTAIGENALGLQTAGIENVAIGHNAGTFVNGNKNVILGSGAGYNMTTASGTVLVGTNAGADNTVDNRLMIDNSNTNTPLLDGDFTGRVLTINNTLKVVDLASGAAVTSGNRPVVADANGQLMIGSPIQSANGLSIIAGKVQLGGTLSTPTTITTDVTNMLRIGGLPLSAATNDFTLVSDASTGQIKRLSQASINANQWKITGNAGTTASSFLGTTDAMDLVFKTNNLERLRVSQTGRLLFKNTTGNTTNLFIGGGNETTSGARNVSLGLNALVANTSGANNTAIGLNALAVNTTGSYNIAHGYQSLFANTTGNDNIALGDQALVKNDLGNDNIAIGKTALSKNIGNTSTTGNNSIAIGTSSLVNATGGNNTAIGHRTLAVNITGINNTAIGYQAGVNTTGNYNILIGASTNSPVAGNSNQLNIGNNIFGTGLTSINATAPAGSIGIGIAAPNSTLQVNGSFSLPIKRVTATTYTASASDYKILVDNAALVTITLPVASTCAGRMYVIQNLDNSVTPPNPAAGIAFNLPISLSRGVTIAAGTALLTSISTSTGTYPNLTYLSGTAITLQSDGTGWIGVTQ